MDAVLPHLNVVIICGQTGNELWPLVHSDTPRETVTFPMEDESLLEGTIRRSLDLTDSPILFVCHPEIADMIEKAVEESGLLDDLGYEILAEPISRGSAFSIALAATSLKRRDPNACMLVMPSHISMEIDDRWERAVTRAYRAASADRVALLGTPPKSASTERCYIRPGKEMKEVVGARHVSDFVCNPMPGQAARCVSVECLWYTGIVAMRVSTAVSQMMRTAMLHDFPAGRDMDRVAETANFLVSIGTDAWDTEEARELVRSLPETSFEESVLSACDRLVSIQTSIDCGLITSLRGIDDAVKADEFGNRIVGRAFAIDSHDTTVFNDDRLTVTLGCENIMVVNTRDSVLVASKDALGSLSEVLPTLIEAGAHEVETSSVSNDGWGTTTLLFESDRARIKLVQLYPGRTIPEYNRETVEEIWTVLQGKALSRTRGSRKTLGPGTMQRYSRKEHHSLENPTQEMTFLMCVEIAKGPKNDG